MSSSSCKTASQLLAKTRDQMEKLRLERTQALELANRKSEAIEAIESVLWRIEDLAKHEAEQAAKPAEKGDKEQQP